MIEHKENRKKEKYCSKIERDHVKVKDKGKVYTLRDITPLLRPIVLDG